MDKDLIDTNMPMFEAQCKNNANKCKLIYTGCAKKNQPVGDYPIELNTTPEMVNKIGKNAYDVGEYSKYDIIAKIMNCSITGGYLAKFDSIPCYYMTLLYSSKFGTMGTIVTVGVNFKIGASQLDRLSIGYVEKNKQLKLDKKKNKKTHKKNKDAVDDKQDVEQVTPNDKQATPADKQVVEQVTPDAKQDVTLYDIKQREVNINLKKLINNNLDGTYSISLSYDKDEKDAFLVKVKDAQDFSEYIKLFMPVEIESYTSKNNIIYNTLLKYLENTKFMEFVHFVLDKRFGDTAKTIDSYFKESMPKTIFNYKQLKDNPDLIDKMLDDDEDRKSNQSSDYDSDENQLDK